MYKINQAEFDDILSNHQLYVNSLSKDGIKIQLNKYDLSKYEIKDVTLTDSFITESTFNKNHLYNVEIFDANLCGCHFNNVIFNSVNFVKTDLSYCIFSNCKFINSKIKRCETNETIFENTKFDSCEIYDSFSYSALKDILFCDMNMKDIEFYKTIVYQVSLMNVEEFDMKKSIISLNIGNFKNKKIITGEKAVEYFQKVCIWK